MKHLIMINIVIIRKVTKIANINCNNKNTKTNENNNNRSYLIKIIKNVSSAQQSQRGVCVRVHNVCVRVRVRLFVQTTFGSNVT